VREIIQVMRRPLSGSVGVVLDPVFSLRFVATLEPLNQYDFVLVTLMARSREEILALASKYRRPESVSRAFEMAWTRSQLEFRYLSIGPGRAHRFLELASNLLYPNPNLRATPVRLLRNRLGQPALWGYGISGDLPILAVLIGDSRSLPLVRELLLAQSSDWAFLMKTGTAREYATQRTIDHLARFNRLHDQFVANNLDEEFLRDCEWRDNIFPNVNWRYYA